MLEVNRYQDIIDAVNTINGNRQGLKNSPFVISLIEKLTLENCDGTIMHAALILNYRMPKYNYVE